MSDLVVMQRRNQSKGVHNDLSNIVLQKVEQLLLVTNGMILDNSRKRKQRMHRLLKLNEFLKDLPSQVRRSDEANSGKRGSGCFTF